MLLFFSPLRGRALALVEEKMETNVTHIYCPVCDGIRPLIQESIDSESFDGKYMAADLICGRCRLVITTVFQENDGRSECNFD